MIVLRPILEAQIGFVVQIWAPKRIRNWFSLNIITALQEHGFSYLGSCQQATEDHITYKSMVGCCEIRCHCDGTAVRNATGDGVEMLLFILGKSGVLGRLGRWQSLQQLTEVVQRQSRRLTDAVRMINMVCN